MRKVAIIKLFWRRSPSDDIKTQRIEIRVDSLPTTGVELGPEFEEMQVRVQASHTVVYRVVTIDEDQQEVPSVEYEFRVGDLEQPQPATDLGHVLLNIIEEPIDPEAPLPPPLEVTFPA